jgi:hypothetical protein
MNPHCEYLTEEIILRYIQYPRPLFPSIPGRTIGSSDKEKTAFLSQRPAQARATIGWLLRGLKIESDSRNK